MRRLIALLLLAALLCGCATMDERTKTVLLDRATRHYERAIRWGDYEEASVFRKPGAAAVAPNPDTYKRFRVTSYVTQSTVMNEDETEAWIVVQIGYYDDEHMKEVTLTDRQTWKYDADQEVWYLESPPPDFR
jgi:hypothetical protein